MQTNSNTRATRSICHGGVTHVDSHPSAHGEGETLARHKDVSHHSSPSALPTHGERETFDLMNISGNEDVAEPQASHPIAAEGTAEPNPSPVNSVEPATRVKLQSDCNHFFENRQCIDPSEPVQKQTCKYC